MSIETPETETSCDPAGICPHADCEEGALWFTDDTEALVCDTCDFVILTFAAKTEPCSETGIHDLRCLADHPSPESMKIADLIITGRILCWTAECLETTDVDALPKDTARTYLEDAIRAAAGMAKVIRRGLGLHPGDGGSAA